MLMNHDGLTNPAEYRECWLNRPWKTMGINPYQVGRAQWTVFGTIRVYQNLEKDELSLRMI